MNSLTIIITASFIPSHPSIKMIQETIESLQLINIPPNTKIILAHDYSNNISYDDYFKNLKEYIKLYSNIKIVTRQTHGHLVGNIRNALKYVKSKYILVMQHDLPFIRKLNVANVISDMEENRRVKHVRFNKRRNIKCGIDGGNGLFGLQVKQSNYTYTRTPGWSDNNHLCLTSYYNDIIIKECKDGGAMEDRLSKKSVDKKTHRRYGTYLFGKLNHPPIIKHTDGRKTQPIKD